MESGLCRIYLKSTPDSSHANEELLGEALAPYHDHVVIATKFGIRFEHPKQTDNHSLITDSRTDHIDFYYQHRIDKNIEPKVVADTMAELIKEGKILHWGISLRGVKEGERLCRQLLYQPLHNH